MLTVHDRSLETPAIFTTLVATGDSSAVLSEAMTLRLTGYYILGHLHDVELRSAVEALKCSWEWQQDIENTNPDPAPIPSVRRTSKRIKVAAPTLVVSSD
jgi:hypothetical protein